MTRQIKGSKCDWQLVCRGEGGRDEMKDEVQVAIVGGGAMGVGLLYHLGHEQTLRVMQTEYMYPVVGDRLSPEDWADGGSLNVRERASRRVAEILALPPPSHITPTAEVLIRDRFPIHLELA